MLHSNNNILRLQPINTNSITRSRTEVDPIKAWWGGGGLQSRWDTSPGGDVAGELGDTVSVTTATKSLYQSAAVIRVNQLFQTTQLRLAYCKAVNSNQADS